MLIYGVDILFFILIGWGGVFVYCTFIFVFFLVRFIGIGKWVIWGLIGVFMKVWKILVINIF